ncbi:galectin-3-like [Emydura macquarii macquarii]|uniref:galectin-3-like n=1 Tax=Emydura macquarii macquarii TaxID=1129001 RepID=UPI00352B25D6
MDLLQQHLPRLHRALREALDYVYTFSTYIFGDQAHPGAEDPGRSRETDPPDHSHGVPTSCYGEGDPEHYGEEAPGGQREDTGHPAPQVPSAAQDPAPQEGQTAWRGSRAGPSVGAPGAASDQDMPHPLWPWPGAVSLEPRSGEPTPPGAWAPPPSPSHSREPCPTALPVARVGECQKGQFRGGSIL